MKATPTGEFFDIKKIARLASLLLTTEEESKFSIQFAAILTYIEKLRQLKIEDIEPTSQVTGLKNVIRDDTTSPSLSQEEALQNTPSKQNGFFKVTAILED